MTIAHKLAIAAFVVMSDFSIASAAEPVEFPSRKSGYWHIKMVTEQPAGAPPVEVQACIDAATDKDMMRAGLSMTKDLCSKNEMSRQGDAIVINAVCQFGPMTTTSQAIMTGDFQSTYSVKVTGEVDGMPAIAGGGDSPMKTEMTQRATWMGDACPAGMKPGDMKMPGGITINTNDMLKGLGGMLNGKK